jgi:hypothetical protein
LPALYRTGGSPLTTTLHDLGANGSGGGIGGSGFGHTAPGPVPVTEYAVASSPLPQDGSLTSVRILLIGSLMNMRVFILSEEQNFFA